jgi:hypothetical protein
MGPGDREHIAPDIEALRQDIDRWRETREKQGPVPEDLWRRAVELARRHGVTQVSRDLRLHYSKLKERVEAGERPASPGVVVAPETTFVELTGASVLGGADVGEVVVEVSGADGSAMSVHVPATVPLDVAGLVESFFGRGR